MKYASITATLESIENAKAIISKAEADIKSIMSIYANKCSEITNCSSFYEFDKKERTLHIQKVGLSVDFIVESKLGFSIVVPIPNDNTSMNGVYNANLIVKLIEGIKEVDTMIMSDTQPQATQSKVVERVIPQDDNIAIERRDFGNERKSKVPRGGY